jgi:hypothetical protein
LFRILNFFYQKIKLVNKTLKLYNIFVYYSHNQLDTVLCGIKLSLTNLLIMKNRIENVSLLFFISVVVFVFIEFLIEIIQIFEYNINAINVLVLT